MVQTLKAGDKAPPLHSCAGCRVRVDNFADDVKSCSPCLDAGRSEQNQVESMGQVVSSVNGAWRVNPSGGHSPFTNVIEAAYEPIQSSAVPCVLIGRPGSLQRYDCAKPI